MLGKAVNFSPTLVKTPLVIICTLGTDVCDKFNAGKFASNCPEVVGSTSQDTALALLTIYILSLTTIVKFPVDPLAVKVYVPPCKVIGEATEP